MKAVIVGAGIGGIATANLLARQGHDVHVYEQAPIAGGRAGQLKAEGFTFDTGPSWYLMPEVFERYFDSVDESIKDHLDIIRLKPSYKVFFEKGPATLITGDLKTDARTFDDIEPGAGLALRQYAADAKKLYDLSLRYFLYTNFNEPRLFLTPAVLGRLPRMIRLMITPIHSYVNTFVRTTRLQQILEYPMVFLGTSPFEAPALYSLMGALDYGSGVYYPRGGIYTIIESLVRIGESNGVTFHYNADVSAIDASGITLSDGNKVPADIIISNADLHYTETSLLAPGDQSLPESYWSKKQASCSALLIYLGVKGSVPELEHHNLLFVDSWKENFEALYHGGTIPEKVSLYLSRTSATDPGVAPDGHETIFVLVPLPSGSETTIDADSLADHYIAQIESMTGASFADRIVYKSTFTPHDFGEAFHSWRNSMLGPSHVLLQSAFWRTPNRSKKVKNLYYVGAGTTPGVGLPMCLISAANVVDRINKDHA